MSWAETWPSVGAAFLASLVEFVEALTVVLAIGAVRGWPGALRGSAAALGALAVSTAAIGPALLSIPLPAVQFAVGLLTLLFGTRWLRKALLRAAGAILLHDEAQAFEREAGRLRQLNLHGGGWDRLAFAGAFKITALEGIEVVFIVVALSATNSALFLPASAGALAALMVVLVVGFAIHKPLTRIPENTLKFLVGTVLSAFGTFWVGEGIGLRWPAEDVALLGLIADYFLAALATARLCSRRVAARATGGRA